MNATRTAGAIAIALAICHGYARGDDVVDSGSAAQASGSDTSALVERLTALEAEVQDLRAGVDSATASAVSDASKDAPFRIYGFIDVGLQKVWTTDPASVATTASTFVLGNVNLYFDFHPVADWSSLVEVRFTNYPDTDDPFVRDPGNSVGDDVLEWSGIVLERAYIQWQHREELGIRAGVFLTPYGIWNVDHGSPTLISLYRPEFVSLQLWPEHQVGVEAFGRVRGVLPGRWALEYHAYVANGRSIGAVDQTEGKMLGARVVARRDHLAFGMSAMYGDGDGVAAPVAVADTQVVTPPGAYEAGLGVDASLDLGALRLRSELITRRVGATLATPPQNQGDAYVLAGYRIPGTRYEPVAFGEALHMQSPDGNLQLAGSLGLNVYFTPSIQLKLQASRALTFADDDWTHAASKRESFLAAKLVMGL